MKLAGHPLGDSSFSEVWDLKPTNDDVATGLWPGTYLASMFLENSPAFLTLGKLHQMILSPFRDDRRSIEQVPVLPSRKGLGFLLVSDPVLKHWAIFRRRTG